MQLSWVQASQILGITLIHSLWQGLVVYLLIRLWLLCAPQTSSQARYRLSAAGMLGLAVWFLYTLCVQWVHYHSVAAPLSALRLNDILPRLLHPQQGANIPLRYEFDLNRYLPYLTILYMGGIAIQALRLGYAWYNVRRLKRSAVLSPAFQLQLNRLSAHFTLKRPVKAMLSEWVSVPCIIGYLKPVLLLPVTLSTGLSAEETESILLHELAHVSRNDYLLNWAQQLIAALLFFNPFVQLLSRSLNEERENCCDDQVVALTGRPLIYAQALYKLENNQQNAPAQPLAMAATGRHYHLFNRIQRIMKTQKNPLHLRPTLLALCLLGLCFGLIILFRPQIAQGKISVRNIRPVVERMLNAPVTIAVTDTLPKKAVKTRKRYVINPTPDAVADTTYQYQDEHISNDSQLLGFTDPEFNQLLQAVQQYSKAVADYYKSDEYKKLRQNMEESNKAVQDYYNSPELKRLEEAMKQNGASFKSKWGGDNGKDEVLTGRISKLGSKIGLYYGSDDFKKLNEALRKKYDLPLNQYNTDKNNPNYKKYQAELERKIPADIQAATTEIKKLGDQMSKRYNLPEYKADVQHFKSLGDSLRMAFNSPQLEAYKQNAKQYYAQFEAYQRSPEFARQQELLKQAGEKLRAYTSSPEYKKRVHEWMNQMRMALGNDFEKVERPEKPEKPEKPEVKEQQEAPEKQ